MNKRMKQPAHPPERRETGRQRILEVLESGPAGLREISVQAGVSERDLPRHLEHLHKSLRQEGRRLAVSPAKCLGCGFLFAKRDRLSKPGRCPVCKGTRVAGPVFSVE